MFLAVSMLSARSVFLFCKVSYSQSDEKKGMKVVLIVDPKITEFLQIAVMFQKNRTVFSEKNGISREHYPCKKFDFFKR